MTRSTVGEKAQVPEPLPPRSPTEWTPELRGKFDQALPALGRLDSGSTLQPDNSLFLKWKRRNSFSTRRITIRIESTVLAGPDSFRIPHQDIVDQPVILLTVFDDGFGDPVIIVGSPHFVGVTISQWPADTDD